MGATRSPFLGALGSAVCLVVIGCSSTGGDDGPAIDGGAAFEAPYPDPRCGQVEQGTVEPATAAELRDLLVGRWIACVGDGAPGLELAANGEWYSLRQIGVGRFDRDLEVEHGTWQVDVPARITFLRVVPDPPGSTGTGGTFTNSGTVSFTDVPRKLTLDQGKKLVPVYILAE